MQLSSRAFRVLLFQWSFADNLSMKRSTGIKKNLAVSIKKIHLKTQAAVVEGSQDRKALRTKLLPFLWRKGPAPPQKKKVFDDSRNQTH